MKKTASIAQILFVMLSLTIAYGCKKDSMPANKPTVDSYLPMQVGNLWYANQENYTEIQDSVIIGGKLFYKFYSLIGGDGVAISFLRIDEQGKLIAGDTRNPAFRAVRGDFNAKVGDKFFTTGDGTDTDQEVTVIQKSDSEITFSFDAVYHPNLKGHPFQVKYIKGQGFPGNWTKLKINGVVYK
ncbi:hypothetical protein DHW03_05830 [Pedobacter yonginense]|uniref:Lipoprotein n=1 Tax=Pedobacter yonginense TaxID=651869 RepID=A0A317ETV7_9SPHI|nr:hypothetical protein [Pedobacter yonginense]PWS29333.1 hypothetical protein DHW03_05830 [Pedobacter yonginense]